MDAKRLEDIQTRANTAATSWVGDYLAKKDIPDLIAALQTERECREQLEAVEGALLAYIRDAALSGNLPMLERAADLRPVMAALAVRWPNAIRAQESTPLHTTLQGIPDMPFSIKGRLGDDDEEGESTPIDTDPPTGA